MKITITMLNVISDDKIDIQVDSQQRIKTTLNVLNENMSEFMGLAPIDEVGIQSSGRRMATTSTYEEAGIYTGDIVLVGINQQDRTAEER